MAHNGTRLSGAGYTLHRAFWFVWRWRTLERLGGATGLSIGRKNAMSAARATLRNLKPPAPDFSLATPTRADPADRGAENPSLEDARRSTPARWPTKSERLRLAPIATPVDRERPPYTH